MKDKIFLLRNQNKSYNQIAKILGCSKALVRYYCGIDQKNKHLIRQRKLRKNNPLKSKLETFTHSIKKNRKKYNISTNKEYIIKRKLLDFNRRTKTKQYLKKDNMANITIEQVQDKLGDNPKCYLTGRPIDINNSRSYNFDHIIPISKDGENTIENLGICIKEANTAKSNLLLEDFLKLCEDILANYGYTVIKFKK